MDTKTQFQKNATILAADGGQVGSLERLVVNPVTKVLTDIVVRTGTLLNREEKVVPIGMVDETAESQIVLREEAGDLENFPLFEERHLVDENVDSALSVDDTPPMFVGYPYLGTTSVTPLSDERIVTRVEQNIPDGTIAMKEGAMVITSEGNHVGNVERVLVDPSVDQVTHLFISKGLLSKETKLIPMQWVLTLGEDKVHLRVRKDSVEALDPVLVHK